MSRQHRWLRSGWRAAPPLLAMLLLLHLAGDTRAQRRAQQTDPSATAGTPSPTCVPAATASLTPELTATASLTPELTATASTPTPTCVPSATTGTASPTPELTPSSSAIAEATSVTPSETATSSPSASPSSAPPAAPTAAATLFPTSQPAHRTPEPLPTPTDGVLCVPGAEIVLTGKGPPRAAFLVAFDQRTVAGGSTDAAGHFRVPLAIGSERAGHYPVTVQQRGTTQILGRWTCIVPDVTPTPLQAGSLP